MQKLVIFLLCIASVQIIHAQREQYVYMLNGSLVINTTDSLNKMTFEGGNVVLTNDDGTTISLLRTDIDSARIIQYSSMHTCLAEYVHNPNLPNGIMSDQEGNVYKTIVIGAQEWMAENLNTSIYRNGDAIPTNLSIAEWQNTLYTQQGAWAYYNNDSSYACPYGKLYNWYAAVDSRQLCPTGWHVPSDAEWSVLTAYLGGENVAGGQMNVAGGQMKSLGTSYWSSPNTSATNSSGFSGLPGGYRDGAGFYYVVGSYGNWWSSTQGGSFDAWYRNLDYASTYLFRYNDDARFAFSVRCLRD